VSDIIDIAIIGGGPAGLAAGLYGSRARAKTVVFEAGLPGGQIVTTEWVENYPAFPEGISGPELADLMLKQTEHFGAEIRDFTPVDLVRQDGLDFVVTADGRDHRARSVILATGAVPKRLGIPGEERFTGRGVSWCATCDGALYRDKVVAVVGGGDAAAQEALFLSKFASRVYMIHRRDQLRATECIAERCVIDQKIKLLWSRTVSEILGEDGKVAGLRLPSTKGEEDLVIKVDGVFIYVGVDPKNELVAELLQLDDHGFVVADERGVTSLPGLYAAGDVTNGELKQVITSAAKGASAAFNALHYIDTKVCSV
jgi:thioredoxin reductase (NADPH)